MASRKPSKMNSIKVEAFALAAEIQDICAGAEVHAAMSALNYVMASIIHDHMNGDEDALLQSDQQTRYVAEILRTGETHH